MFEFPNLYAEIMGTNPPFELPVQRRGREAEKAFYRSGRTTSFIHLVWTSGELISRFLPAECIRQDIALVRG